MPFDLLNVPAFPRVTDYLGPWAVEQKYFDAQLRLLQNSDLLAHVRAHSGENAPRPTSALEKVTTQTGKTVAVVRVTGTLMKASSSLGNSSSTVQIRRDIRQAAGDPDVAGILLAIDSPGGTVAGTDDLAAEVRAARQRKPVWAQIEDLGASAAYWIASQAEKVFANSPTAMVGSIGTIMTVYDLSGAAEKEGIKALVFQTGSLKGTGAPGAPVTDEQVAYLQDIVDQSQKSFDAAVRKGRGLTEKQLKDVRSGAVFLAEAALARNLIDGIQAFDKTLTELSRVSRSRSQSAAVTVPGVQAPAPPNGATTMDFQQWLAANGFGNHTFDETQRRAMEAAWRAATQTPLTALPPGAVATPFAASAPVAAAPPTAMHVDAGIEESRARTAAEVERQSQIQTACAAANNPRIEVGEGAAKRSVSLAAHAISSGWSLDRFNLELHRAVRPEPAPAMMIGGSRSGEVNAQAIEASMCLALGISAKKLERWFTPQVLDQAMSRQYRGASISGLSAHVIAAAGRHYRPGKVNDDFVQEALLSDRILGERALTLGAAAGFTTLSLSGILGNVANKALINAYEAVEVTWPKFCAVRSHGDFKVHTRYRLDNTGSFRKVGPTGELKHAGLSESSYTNQLGTYGCLISLTRQMQIDDDLGAFAQMPAMLGRMAAIRPEEAVYVLLLSNPGSFFSVGNRNYMSGGSSALAIDSLTTGKQKFLDQVDSNGKPILARPAILLVPTTLDETGRLLATEANIIAGTSTAKQPAKNPHAGTVEKVSSPYLNNTAIRDQDGAALSGQSDTAWHLFANPADRAAIAVAFLNGQQMPTIESAETDFKMLGMQWRAFSDFGVGMEDSVAALKSAGQ